MELYITFLFISIGVMIAMILLRIFFAEKKRANRILTHEQFLAFSVFLAAVLLFIPIHYSDPTGYFEDTWAWIRPLLISAHSALRLFILDGDFKPIIEATHDNMSGCVFFHALFGFYAALIFVAAPVLTTINVLALFKSVWYKARFLRVIRRPICIFSDLNERSIAMAEEIYSEEHKKDGRRKKKKRDTHIIVFTDVFEKESRETDYDLLMRAYDIKALLLKADIARLKIKHKKGNIEFFLIGDNEAENVEQMIKLTENFKNYTKASVSVYLFSSTVNSGYILDSIDKGPNTVNKKILEAVEKNADGFLNENTDCEYGITDSFYLRRIDTINNLALKTLSDVKLVKHIFSENKDPSIMIVGCGEQGMAFLKTALWLYQTYDHTVRITVVDAKSEKEITERILSECPDLTVGKEYDVQTDARYEITVKGDVDILRSDVFSIIDDKLLLPIGAAFVTLGDDDKDIEASVKLRRMFSRAKISASQKKLSKDQAKYPLIYSVVYDEKKASNLDFNHNDADNDADDISNPKCAIIRLIKKIAGKIKKAVEKDKEKSKEKDGEKAEEKVEEANEQSNNDNTYGLKNYRNESYNINFIGSLKDQYSYDIISEMKKLEKDAFKYHMQWIRMTSKLRKLYSSGCDKKLDGEEKKSLDSFTTYMDFIISFGKEDDPWGDKHLYKTISKDKKVYTDVIVEKLQNQIRQYSDYEYPRNSSAAKAIHKKMLKEALGKDDNGHILPCECEECCQRRITEHMRWDMYMRVIGYRKSYISTDHRAQTHKDLAPWMDLKPIERYKD